MIMSEKLIRDNAACCWGRYLTNRLELMLADTGYHDQAQLYFIKGLAKVKNPELHEFYSHVYDSVRTVENLLKYQGNYKVVRK